MPQKICVIGAGICGVSTAIWLQRHGHDVVLVDRDTPGQAASFGNAGLIAQWASIPVNTPKLWGSLPSILFDPNSALFLRWSYVPQMLPWLIQFMGNATDRKTHHVSQSLHSLLYDAVDQHKTLAQGTPVSEWIQDSTLSYLYQSEKDFDADAYSWNIKRDLGLSPTLVRGDDIQDAEPNVGKSIKLLAQLHGHGHITNPGEYVHQLAEHFVSLGGTFIQATVTDFDKSGDTITQALTDQGPIAADQFVVTSGIWSKSLMRKIGLNIPLETERGYHIIFKDASGMPSHPMMAAGKFAITPMGPDLRCAGTVELGGLALPRSKKPIAIMRKYLNETLPNLSAPTTSEWMGFRPSTPDSMPLIGRVRNGNVFTGFGHQHIGLTAGPKTARILADMISNRPINGDYSAFDPNRYV